VCLTGLDHYRLHVPVKERITAMELSGMEELNGGNLPGDDAHGIPDRAKIANLSQETIDYWIMCYLQASSSANSRTGSWNVNNFFNHFLEFKRKRRIVTWRHYRRVMMILYDGKDYRTFNSTVTKVKADYRKGGSSDLYDVWNEAYTGAKLQERNRMNAIDKLLLEVGEGTGSRHDWLSKVSELKWPKGEDETVKGLTVKEMEACIRTSYEGNEVKIRISDMHLALHQVSHVRYMQKYTDNEGQRHGTGFQVKAGPRAHSQDVTSEWIRQYFDEDFNMFVKKFGMRDQGNKWIKIPAGNATAARSESAEGGCNLIGLQDRPLIYQQKNRHTCLFSGVASALAASGLEAMARTVENMGRVLANKRGLDCQMKALVETIKRDRLVKDIRYYERPKSERRGKRKKWNLFDLSKEEGTDVFGLVLQSGDYLTMDHGVGLFNGAVYDSTRSHALELNEETLMWCSNTTKGKSYKVWYAVRIVISRLHKEQVGLIVPAKARAKKA
jgi:hypothetical protein